MNKKEKNENKIKENKKNIFWGICVVILSLAILFVLMDLLFSNSRINEGKFRVTDVIATCNAEFVNKSEATNTWSYDVHQTNTISLLINSGDAKIKRAYISNVYASLPTIEISCGKQEEVIKSGDKKELNLVSTADESGKVLYDIKITNKGVLNNFEIPSDVKEIRHDATAFLVANISEENLKFQVSFNLNIQEENGKINTVKVKLDLPYDGLVKNGNVVTRIDTKDFVFKLH